MTETPVTVVAGDTEYPDSVSRHRSDLADQSVPVVRRVDSWRRAGVANVTTGTRRVVADLRSFEGLMLLACLILRAAPVSITPTPGVDAGWVTALNVARQDNLRFGRDLEYTYGPWGFLDVPLGISRINLLAGIAFASFCLIVGWVALRSALRRCMRSDLAAIAATVILTLAMPLGGASSVLVLGLALLSLDYVGPSAARPMAWLPAFSAMCAAFVLQIKFSEGVLLAVVLVVVLIFAPAQRIRRTLECVIVYLITTVIAWLLAQQSLGDLPHWFKVSVEISQGYPEAMSTDYVPHALSYLLIVAVMLTIVVYLVRLLLTREWRPAIGVSAVSVVVVYIAFREATNRHDSGHEVFFYLWAIPVLAWFATYGRSRTFRLSLLAVAALLAYSGVPIGPLAVHARLTASYDSVASDEYHSYSLYQAQAAAQTHYAVPLDMRYQMAGHPVQVDGAEATLPWAYGLTWRPAPVFQSYVAFTDTLDGVNSDWLRNSASDQLVLRPTETAIDGRNSLWDSPQYVVAEMCNLRVESAEASWLLLQKGADRCGPSRSVGAMHVRAGESVNVPAADASDLLTMSFHADSPGLVSRAVTLLDKSYTHLQVIAGGTAYRLPRALADGPLIVSVPAAVGWPAAFGGETSYRQVTFNESGTVEFNQMSIGATGS